MPNFDGTGPNGLGRMTGKGMGNCQQAQGCCRFGRGRNCRFTPSMELTTTHQERIEKLKENKKKLELEIESLEKTQNKW